MIHVKSIALARRLNAGRTLGKMFQRRGEQSLHALYFRHCSRHFCTKMISTFPNSSAMLWISSCSSNGCHRTVAASPALMIPLCPPSLTNPTVCKTKSGGIVYDNHLQLTFRESHTFYSLRTRTCNGG